MLTFLIYIVPAVINIACIIHLFRNNKPWWWLLVIWLLSPYVGALVYFFFEILPGLSGASKSRYAPTQPAKPVDAVKRIAELEKELEFSDTVDTRLQLAEAYLAAEDAERALALYEECNRGVFKDDPPILFGIAECQFEMERWPQLLETLDKLDQKKYLDYANDRGFMRARASESTGRAGAAISAYERIKDSFDGEEARYRMAQLLEQQNRQQEAAELYKEIIQSASHAQNGYRRREKDWIKGAEERLKELPE